MIEEVIVDVDREQRRAALTLRWQWGALTELTVALPKDFTDRQAVALARIRSEPPAARYGAPTSSRKPSAASSSPASAPGMSRC
jgi:hypothetical protein